VLRVFGFWSWFRTFGKFRLWPVADQGPEWICRGCSAPLDWGGSELRCERCSAVISDGGGFLVFDPGFEPAAFAPERREHLADIEAAHFWFGPRRRLLEKTLELVQIGSVAKALELGCGGGGFLPALSAQVDTVTGLDAYSVSLETAHRESPGVFLAQADIEDPPLADGQFDLIVMLDVLEHVDPDRALSRAAALAVEGGVLMVSVPAFPSLWSSLDVAAGHRCRYRFDTLRDDLERNGWRVEWKTHYQMLAFPVVWAARKLGGRRLKRMERHPPRFLSKLFGCLNGFEVWALGGLSLPWGSSLIVVGRKA